MQDESAAQIGVAEGQGNQLAREVSDNMEMMEGVNKQLSDIMNESLKVFFFKWLTFFMYSIMSCLYISLFWKAKQDNLDLTGKVSILKQEYDDRHETMTNEIADAEMHKLANTLVENKQQQKDAKDLELELRQRLTSYDEKFTSLHSSLEATNSGYTTFTGQYI